MTMRGLGAPLCAALALTATFHDTDANAAAARRGRQAPVYGPSRADRATRPADDDDVVPFSEAHPHSGEYLPGVMPAEPEPMMAPDSGMPLPGSPAMQPAMPSPPPMAQPEGPAAIVPPPPPLAAAPAAPVPPVTASESTIVILIQSLVQEGILTQDRANTLIRQARDEAAAAARGQRTGAVVTAAPAPQPAPSAAPAATAPEAPAQTAQADAGPPSIRVPYIPQVVRNQIRDEVKQELVQEAILQNWAKPDEVPDWTKRIHIFGDMRVRYEWDIFDPRNSPFNINYASLDSNPPFDLQNAAGTLPPLLNTTEDRQRARIRARLGLDADISPDFKAGLRLATGNEIYPVTTMQNLGTTLNKDKFLLDRAFIEYTPLNNVSLWFGRFPNPWFYTDLVWDDDLAFDGFAGQFNAKVAPNMRVFSTAGAFPIEIGLFNFPDNSNVKEKSRDKWLYGAQAGLEWTPARDYSVNVAASFYDFDSIQGRLSSPCVAANAIAQCDSDNSRPGYLQTGNTLFGIRNLLPVDPSTPPDKQPLFQYYGLSSRFEELDLTARVDYSAFTPLHLIFDGDFVENLGFNRAKIAASDPVNNRGPSSSATTLGAFTGGNKAFQTRLTFGYPVLINRWDWNVFAEYRYLESDSVVDVFTDADFHLGGTNAKGYVVGAGVGVDHNVNLTARWLSASEISSLPYSVDVVLVDLNAQF